MAIREVLKMGDPRLLAVASRYESSAPGLENLLADMRDTIGSQWAGLAAPQIGVGLRVVIFGMDYNPRYPEPPGALHRADQSPIDPPQRRDGGRLGGCLSVPGMRGWSRGSAICDIPAWTPKPAIDRSVNDFHDGWSNMR